MSLTPATAKSPSPRGSGPCIVEFCVLWGCMVASIPVPAGDGVAGDWTHWRHGPARAASSDARLPDDLHLLWMRELPPQRPAWTDEGSLQFDRGYRPVAKDDLLFVGSTRDDSVTGYDLGSGAERWRFFTEGPVRVAPVAWRDRVMAASDDGHLYCLRAADGSVAWKFRGGPSSRRLVGNERVISTWPVRGGPVVSNDTVYFAAGVWPFMGVFIHALDADTGRVLWTNDSLSFSYRRLPHPGSEAFSGLSPQGHLAVAGDRLLVPGSRYQPAILDRTTGRLLSYADAASPAVLGWKHLGITASGIFDLRSGLAMRLKDAGRLGLPVLTESAWYASDSILDPESIEVEEDTVTIGEHDSRQLLSGTIPRSRAFRGTPWLRAADRLVVSRKRDLELIELPEEGRQAQTVWKVPLDGTPCDVLMAEGRLLVVTRESTIRCFGAGGGDGDVQHHPAPITRGIEAEPHPLPAETGVQEGYCLVWGLRDEELVDGLIAGSKLHVIGVDGDPARIRRLRARLSRCGLYGLRCAAIAAEPAALEMAPYLASLVVVDDPVAAGLGRKEGFLRRLFRVLRPYGGLACLRLDEGKQKELERQVEEAGLEGARVRRQGDWAVLERSGALPGAADWLGQNADAGNTRTSRDRRVRAPLGVLWFGNALSNSLVLPRHGEGPVEQIVGGRMFIEGPDSLSAMDIYTGRLLWTRTFPGLGRLYDSTKHQRGAHSIGSNFFAVLDAVYVGAGESCHLLDPASGRPRKTFELPRVPDEEKRSEWQFILVYGDLLLAGSHPIVDPEQSPRRVYSPTSSRRLVVMDRRSGKVLWVRDAAHSFRHYGIAAGGGKVFLIDRLSPETRTMLSRRGKAAEETPRILALEARTGDLFWQTQRCVGPSLSFSGEHDVVVSAGALDGDDGSVLWEIPDAAERLWFGKWGILLRGREIITQGKVTFDLLTGKPKMRKDAAGEMTAWTFPRSHGCGPMAGSEHLLTFRSACAGFFDLARDGGTGNLGGFRTGCTSNLIAAGGVLCAPDYTRTCGCAYQNRSSLGLVHMPEVEYWTHGAFPASGRLGVNFGAPGDRRADNGTLWLEYPVVGGSSPPLPVEVRLEKPRWFLHHSSRVESVPGDGTLAWVAASGVVGAGEIRLRLDDVVESGSLDGAWTVRLHLVEPRSLKAGERVFTVIVGDRPSRRIDIAAETGGAWRPLVVTFSGLKVAGDLEIRLEADADSRPPLLCGIEALSPR